MKPGLVASLLLVFGTAGAYAQDQKQQSAEGDLNATVESMSHEHHHTMGPHMHMSSLRSPQPGDEQKAQEIADQARKALEPYKDYKAALADGFKIFLPNIPQKMYHFSKWQNGVAAAFAFDPMKPSSLLYEKTASGYKLIGAMYTAPYRFTEDQLNERVPLSVTQWHQHVNLCRPPKGQGFEMLGKDARFGLNGSISTQEACEAAGGTFMPHVLGWMVHIYPWEKTQDAVWSIERQMKTSADDHQHDGMDMSH